MIKRIIFLATNRFSLRDYRRFGIELLQKNGFDVEVWELTPIVYPEFSRDYNHPDLFNFGGLKVFDDRQKAYNELLNLTQSDFVVSLMTFRWLSLGFYRALSRSRTNYSCACISTYPSSVVKKAWPQALAGKVRYIASFRRMETWKRLFIMRLPLWCLGVRPASLMLAAGEKYLDCRYDLRLPVDKNTEVLQIHPLDYDLYLKEKDNLCPESPIAVFLDEFFPFHPDFKIFKSVSPVNADSYFKLLNNFFDLVEEKTGLKVVIAAHPRSQYEKLGDYFNGRKCLRGRTASLVRESRLVLNHCSSAVNFASLFYKPVIFMACSSLNEGFVGDYIRQSAKSLNKTPIFIDRDVDIDWEQELKVDKSHYDSYREAYIKVKDSKDLPFWQIVADRLRKGFGENIKSGRKIILFERLNFVNFVLAVVYRKAGFRVMYFMIDEKIKESRFFKKAGKKFSINGIPRERFDFDVDCSASEYALNNVDSIYESFLAKRKFIKIIVNLFNSNLIHLVYKKIISKKLHSFYCYQIALNALVKKKALDRIYHAPSEFIYFMSLARRHPSLYILNKGIKIAKSPFLINLFYVLYQRITQFLLLILWPFVLIKNVKKIIPSKINPREYNIAIRIYKTGFDFKSEYRNIDFLLDGKNITKDNTLFCIDTELDRDFREELVRRKYHFVDIPNILREVDWRFIKDVYFAKLLPVWLKLCIVSILEPPFIVSSYRGILGLYLRWSFFLDRYSIKNFVVHNDFDFTHITRNILLSQRDVRTWYYAHSSHTVDLFTPPQADKELRSIEFSHLYYDNFVSWGRKMSRFYKEHNNIGNYINIGCLWSEHTRRIIERNDHSKILDEIRAKCKQNGLNGKKIIGVFDTSFGTQTPLVTYDIKFFLEGISNLAKERNDVIFVIKLKNQLRYLKDHAPEAFPYYEKIKKRSANLCLLENSYESSLVNAMCDLTISACFTSTLNEALGCRKKAIYFDATNRFTGRYYDKFPNLIAHGYSELVKLVDHWLYKIKDEEFSEYIDKYIKDELDPYIDGRAITRFRELLTK